LNLIFSEGETTMNAKLLGMIFLASAALATSACGDDTSADPTGSGGGNGGAAGDGGNGGTNYDELFACEENEFSIDKPVTGPGFDPAQGGIIGEPQDTYVVHATQIYPIPGKETEFLAVAGPVIAQLNETEGLLAFGLGRDNGCGVSRTMGIWESEEAMYAFVGSGAHAVAMTQSYDVGLTGKTTHWEVTAEELDTLDWDTGRAKLDEIEPGL
jgi:heme-degrading monooxygenase HmoA